jgi:hypothetical protein
MEQKKYSETGLKLEIMKINDYDDEGYLDLKTDNILHHISNTSKISNVGKIGDNEGDEFFYYSGLNSEKIREYYISNKARSNKCIPFSLLFENTRDGNDDLKTLQHENVFLECSDIRTHSNTTIKSAIHPITKSAFDATAITQQSKINKSDRYRSVDLSKLNQKKNSSNIFTDAYSDTVVYSRDELYLPLTSITSSLLPLLLIISDTFFGHLYYFLIPLFSSTFFFSVFNVVVRFLFQDGSSGCSKMIFSNDSLFNQLFFFYVFVFFLIFSSSSNPSKAEPFSSFPFPPLLYSQLTFTSKTPEFSIFNFPLLYDFILFTMFLKKFSHIFFFVYFV